jgi:hypothetical protein
LSSTIAELLGASLAIFLLENAVGSLATQVLKLPRNYARYWTSVHLDFAVPEIERALANTPTAGL